MNEPIHLIECRTSDDLIHQGFLYEPQKKGNTALVWVHGLSGNFYRNYSLHDALIAQCKKHGWAYLSCNTRGHDALASIRKIDSAVPTGVSRVAGGAGQENFTECVYDIQAFIDYLGTLGYSRIILIGHSTGANKVCYYGASYPYDKRVKGIVLASPIRDRLTAPSYLGLILLVMRFFVALGLGNKLLFVPFIFFPITPNRFLSLFSRSQEDVFAYGEKPPRPMNMVADIHYPVYVMFGQEDEMADRPVGNILREFDSQNHRLSYTSVCIPGSDHGFDGYEPNVARHIAGFIQTLLLKK